MKKASQERAPHPIQQTVQNKGIGKHQGIIPGFVADSPPLNLFYELFRLSISTCLNGFSLIGLFILLMILPSMAFAQQYDLLLKGGHLIDPKSGIDSPMDVAVKGDVIARVAENIPESQAEQIINMSGMYVVPGLVDIHTHVFHGTDQDRYLRNRQLITPGLVCFRF